MRRFSNWLIVAAFIGIIAAPPVANLLGVDGADAEAENRKLADFPAATLTWTGVKAFLPGLDAWSSDHFAFRSTLVTWYGISRYLWLHVSSSPSVTIGPDGWLFFVDDGGLEDFTNADLLSETAIQNWRDTIVRAQRWCRARGR